MHINSIGFLRYDEEVIETADIYAVVIVFGMTAGRTRFFIHDFAPHSVSVIVRDIVEFDYDICVGFSFGHDVWTKRKRIPAARKAPPVRWSCLFILLMLEHRKF
jgi:hypothetical protein